MTPRRFEHVWKWHNAGPCRCCTQKGRRNFDGLCETCNNKGPHHDFRAELRRYGHGQKANRAWFKGFVINGKTAKP